MTEQADKSLIAGKFELLERAGEGGMATVYRAVMHGAAGFSRLVAIKAIRPNLLSNNEFVDMFVEEARVGSQLQHPNIVQTFDFGQDDQGTYFLVLEWVEGIDLGHYLTAYAKSGHRCDWPLVAAIGVESLRGLGAAHDRVDAHGKRVPVIHRDVGPQNILIGTNGIVKLSDFGLSRAMDRLQMTHPDMIKGKLRYLAPEVTMGQPASPQSDLFSLGIVMWEALAEQPLYPGRSDAEVFMAARKAEIPPLKEFRDDLPDELIVVVERALAREPEARFKSAKEMLRGLTKVLRNVAESTDAYTISQTVLVARRFLGLSAPRTVPPISS
jgi:serine/threonine protein kinase